MLYEIVYLHVLCKANYEVIGNVVRTALVHSHDMSKEVFDSHTYDLSGSLHAALTGPRPLLTVALVFCASS